MEEGLEVEKGEIRNMPTTQVLKTYSLDWLSGVSICVRLDKIHYTVRGFGKDGHAHYTLHIPCGSEDHAEPFQNGSDWEAKKHLDVGKRCVDLRKSLVKGGLDGETEQRQTVLSAECLAQLRRWIK